MSESGVGIPFSSVEVRLIDAKEADDFLKRKLVEAEIKSAALQSNYLVLVKNQEVARDAAIKTKIANDEYVKNDSYTNEPEYLALVKESNDNFASFKKMQKAFEYLKAKYGVPPEIRNIHYTKEQQDAFAAEQYDIDKMQSLHYRSEEIDRKVNEFYNRTKNQKDRETQAAQQEFEQAEREVSEAMGALANLKTASFYLGDFDPVSIESALTDEKGDFTLHNPQKNTKIFVKLRTPESSESCFWLVDLPPKGKKLVLSNNNVFTIPANSPK